MLLRIIFIFFSTLFITLSSISFGFYDKIINSEAYKFSISIPDDWTMIDSVETVDKDGVSYSFRSNDKKCSVMLLAFKLETVKNLEDFIYNMEKDVNLNIPKRITEYELTETNSYDLKSATYKDKQYTEQIYYLRTKLIEAPYNYIYMLRFITANAYVDNNLLDRINKIASSFTTTAE